MVISERFASEAHPLTALLSQYELLVKDLMGSMNLAVADRSV
jgi:hypothetical protein